MNQLNKMDVSGIEGIFAVDSGSFSKVKGEYLGINLSGHLRFKLFLLPLLQFLFAHRLEICIRVQMPEFLSTPVLRLAPVPVIFTADVPGIVHCDLEICK